jgi:hypothetical protein
VLRRAKEKGNSARAPRERKEGGRGRGPAERHNGEDMGCGSGLGPELGARAAERGQAAHERGKGRRERECVCEGEVAFGWHRPDGGTRWQREKADEPLRVGPSREKKRRKRKRIKFKFEIDTPNLLKLDLIQTIPS